MKERITPRKFYLQLEAMVDKSDGNKKIYYTGALWGAWQIMQIYNQKAKEYREKHREELRAYNTAYVRARRAKAKEMKEGIDKIAEMR